MKSKRGLSALTLLGVFILCLSFVSADFVDNGGSAQNVTDCGILNTTDGVYTLNQSLSSSFDCITINATGIVLDCAFYNITFGNETGGLGIMVSGDGGETSLNNVTVENCYVIQNISGSNESAIFFGPGSENAIVYNNIIETYGNETRGIIIGDNSINANVSLNLVYTNSSGATGIEIADNGFNATIKDNVVLTLGNDASGIFLMDNVSDVNIYNNTLWQMGNRTLSNAMGGIVLEQNTHDLNVSFNIIISGYASGLSIGDDYILEDENWTLDGGGYNASGIWIWGTNLTADNNIMISFGDLGKGIFMNNVEGVNLMSNIIVTVGEGGHGILSEMSETSPLTFYNNLIGTFGENASGIYLNQDGYDNISSNEIYTYGNYSYGIFFVQSHNTTVFGNEIVTDVPTSHVLYLNTSGEELIYNNLFNTSTNDSGVYIIN
ncbi:MAG: right-handed parallel beta-helix repeat-containing protein, partial [Nanoarchaeota archaeon]|nr:right-handed parallel beta-helix repeat-containing protein [Nanoarchaeota archaeon]